MKLLPWLGSRSPLGAGGTPRQGQAFAGAGDANVKKAALLVAGAFLGAAFMGKDAFLKTGEINVGKLQAFAGVQGYQGDTLLFFEVVLRNIALVIKADAAQKIDQLRFGPDGTVTDAFIQFAHSVFTLGGFLLIFAGSFQPGEIGYFLNHFLSQIGVRRETPG